MPNEMPDPDAVTQVKQLCILGQIDRAVRLCKRASIDPIALSNVFQDSMRKMFNKGRSSELLSFLFKNEDLSFLCPIAVPDLLRQSYNGRDYAGFLKQVYRFQLAAELRNEIDDAINCLLDSGQIETANAYRLKFSRLSEDSDVDKLTNHQRGTDASCLLCDAAFAALKRIAKGGARRKMRHCCELSVGSATSASVYHHGEGIKVYIHCPSDQIECLMEMAEFGQIRTIKRSDPDAVRKSKRPIIALAYCKTDVELVMPLAAFSNSLTSPFTGTTRGFASKTSTDHLDHEGPHIEGARRKRVATSVERNPKARAACIAIHGTRCHVCEIDFEEVYGILGRGFIHVHHLMPLATADEARLVDPVQDLRPVCPNCHAMLHRRTPPYSITELQRIRRLSLRSRPSENELSAAE